MTNWFENEILNNQLNIVKVNMQSNLKSGDQYLNGTLDYLLLNSGKMLRPAFLLIGSQFGSQYNKKEEELIKLATAIETLHIATLIHDDIIDDSKKRRGMESIQSKYSKDYAVYMGDYLLSKCFLLLTELEIPKELAIRLAKVVSKICVGEIRQHKNRYNLNMTPIEYLRIVSGKTAALFAIGLSAGSFITKSKDDVIKKLANAGYQLGMAFQIVDDLLDFTGDEDKVGKDLRSDLLRGNYCMPVIFALRDESPYRELIRKELESGLNNDNFEKIIDYITKSGAIEKTKKLALRYHDRALDIINKLPENSGKDILLSMIPKLIQRIH